jgi:hypothetical protein
MKLQEIIDKEDKANPLSDDDLVAELGKHGLTVARRTVTKYRKAMNIPSSRQRRDWTAAAKNGAVSAQSPNGPVAQPPTATGAAVENGIVPPEKSVPATASHPAISTSPEQA